MNQWHRFVTYLMVAVISGLIPVLGYNVHPFFAFTYVPLIIGVIILSMDNPEG